MRASLIVALIILISSCDVSTPVEGNKKIVNLYGDCFADTTCKYYDVKDSVFTGLSSSYEPLQIGNRWRYYFHRSYGNFPSGSEIAYYVNIFLVDTSDSTRTFRIQDSSTDRLVVVSRISQENYEYLLVSPLDFISPLYKSAESESLQILMDDGSYMFKENAKQPFGYPNHHYKVFQSNIGKVYEEYVSNSEGGSMHYEHTYMLLIDFNNTPYNYCCTMKEFNSKLSFLENKQ
jgi:hypothetical protein